MTVPRRGVRDFVEINSRTCPSRSSRTCPCCTRRPSSSSPGVSWMTAFVVSTAALRSPERHLLLAQRSALVSSGCHASAFAVGRLCIWGRTGAADHFSWCWCSVQSTALIFSEFVGDAQVTWRSADETSRSHSRQPRLWSRMCGVSVWVRLKPVSECAAQPR